MTIPGVREGETAVLSGNVLDMAAANIASMHVAWGDGAEDTYPYNGTTSAFSFEHVDVDDDPTGTAVDEKVVPV